ncbi:MAG: hypothetical protein HC893_14645 [Chloroflexaceae bacterium]|nr:hypothetical protein [Chloroflexaceae bacterium]
MIVAIALVVVGLLFLVLALCNINFITQFIRPNAGRWLLTVGVIGFLYFLWNDLIPELFWYVLGLIVAVAMLQAALFPNASLYTSRRTRPLVRLIGKTGLRIIYIVLALLLLLLNLSIIGLRYSSQLIEFLNTLPR